MDLQNLLDNVQIISADISKTINHLLVIGPTGAGKSALSNTITNDQNLIFQEQQGSGGSFLPKTLGRFKISQNHTQSMTLIPQGQQINDKLTIWDLAGFGDNRSVEIDVQTTLLTSLLFAKCQNCLILLLIPHKQFLQDKAQKLVEILNMITDENPNIILVISKCDKKLSTKYIKDFLINWICNEKQTRLTDCSKKLLKKIIDHEQILIFCNPVQNNEEGEYKFCQENITQIQKMILNENLYTQLKFQLKFSPRSQEYVDNLDKQLFAEIQRQELKLSKLYIYINLNQFKFNTDILNQLQDQLQKQYIHEFEKYRNFINNYNEISAKIGSQGYNISPYDKSTKDIEKQIQSIWYYNTGQELYITGLKYSSTQLMSQMQEFDQQSIKITEIHILSIISFIIDQDIILHGVNIHISTSELIVQKQSFINLKGLKGEPFLKAQILCWKIRIKWWLINSDLLTVNLSGGDGGDGQDGADGKDGLVGEDGDKECVLKRDINCYVKYDELPIHWAQNCLTFNRTFNCYFISKGQSGTQGGDARQGGQGGDSGNSGIILVNQPQKINVIDKESQMGRQGKDGEIGKGGQYGKNYVGVNKVVRIFGRIIQPDNLEKKQDNIGQGILLSGVTTVSGASGGAIGRGAVKFALSRGVSTVAKAGKQVVTQVVNQAANTGSKLGLQAVIEGCVASVTLGSVAIAAATTIVAQGVISIAQLLVDNDGEWISKHYEPSQTFANPGNLLKTDQHKETREINDLKGLFQIGIQNQRKFKDEQLDKIKLLYPYDQLSNQLIEESKQIPK